METNSSSNRIAEDDDDDDNIVDTTRPKTNTFFSKMANSTKKAKVNETNDVNITPKIDTNQSNIDNSSTSGGFFSKFTGISNNSLKNDIGFSLFKNDVESSTQIKIGNKLKVGYYKLSSEEKVVKYVYVPSHLALQSSFNIDDVFVALGIATPNLMFEMNVSTDVDSWNVRLPQYKTSLIGAKHPNPEKGQYNGSLRHYEGFIRENCKRLLRGTSAACFQAGALFKVRAAWRDKYKIDYISEWLSEVTTGFAGFHRFHPEILQRLMENSHNFNATASEEDEEELRKVLNIDTEPWFKGLIRHDLDDRLLPLNSIPFPKMTHLIISDDIKLVMDKVDRGIPTGMIVIHGGPGNTVKLCETIHKGNPIFLFKYTGGTADLACETLTKIDQFLRKKRSNPSARPEHPFGTSLPLDYQHPRWLKPFKGDNLESCRILNILTENFPDRYNPSSILQIDMFNTSEEKLQDQLTKTMSVVFEGVVELGGASAESRRLTYAWRIRHLFAYNASRQKFMSDILQVFVIVFSLVNTIIAVLYTYFTAQSCDFSSSTTFFSSDSSTAYRALLILNLLLPLSVTILRGFFASLDPMGKYAILKIAAIRIESEIFMYRTKVGRYNTRKITTAQQQSTSSNSNNKKKEDKEESTIQYNPRKIFSQALDLIWKEITNDMSAGVLRSPPESQDPLESINKRIISNIKEQNMFTTNLKQPFKGKGIPEHKSFASFFNSPKTVNKPVDHDMSINMADIYTSNDTETDDHKTLNISPLGRQRSNSDSESLFGDGVSNDGQSVQGSVQSQNKALDSDIENAKFKFKDTEHELDDGLGSLTADEYVKIRLTPLIAAFSTKAPPMATMNTAVTLSTIFLSVISSVLTTFHLVTFIPIALAISSALTSWTSYLQLELRLVRTNSAVHQLHQLIIWWDSLNMIEKRVSSNKEYLVMTTEGAIQGQIVAAVSSNNGNNNDDVDDDVKDTKGHF